MQRIRITEKKQQRNRTVKRVLDYLVVIAAITGVTLFGIVRGFYDVFSHVNADFRLESLYECEIDGFDNSCAFFYSEMDPDYGPRIIVDITNNNKKPIILDAYDGCQISLEKYIPYEELNVDIGNKGATPWEEPKNWNVELGTEKGIYSAVPEKSIGVDNPSNAFLEIDVNKSDRFIIYVTPSQPGYYKFRVLLNYNINNKKHKISSKKYFEYVRQAPNSL